MSDNNFFFGGGTGFEEWLRKIVEDSLRKFLPEQNIPYHSPNPDASKILNLREAAAYCGVCTRTLITRVREGKLKQGGTGRNYRFRVGDLDAFMFNEKI